MRKTNRIGRKVMSFILAGAMLAAYYVQDRNATKVRADGEIPSGFLTGITRSSDIPDTIPPGWYIKVPTYDDVTGSDAEKAFQTFCKSIRTPKNTYNAESKTFYVSTATQLAAFAQAVNSGNNFSGKTVKLTKDIDLGGGGIKFTPNVTDAGTGDFTVTVGCDGTPHNLWQSIGSYSKPFKGTFDGDGHVVSGLVSTGSISTDGRGSHCLAGVFGYVENAVVRRLCVSGLVCPLDYSYVPDAALLCGDSLNCQFSRCCCVGDVVSGATGNGCVGGLVGGCSGATACSTCWCDVMVLAGCSAGGCCGAVVQNYSPDATLRDCAVHGLVASSSGSCGGVAGCCWHAELACCYSSAEVRAVSESSHWAGGLVGEASSNVSAKFCFASGRVSLRCSRFGKAAGVLTGSSDMDVSNSCYRASNAGLVIDRGDTFTGDLEQCKCMLGVPVNVTSLMGNVPVSLPDLCVDGGFDFENVWKVVEGDFPKLRAFNARPDCDPPEGLVAAFGSRLEGVPLNNTDTNTPGTWSWMPEQGVKVFDGEDVQMCLASFEPFDTDVYRPVQNIEVEVRVIGLPTDRAGTYGDLVSSVPLPDNWAWDDYNEGKILDRVGANLFLATYTPEDTNYNKLNTALAVLVNKRSIQLDVDDSIDIRKTYDGTKAIDLTEVPTGMFGLNGAINGDTVGFEWGELEFESASAGTDTNVVFKNFKLTGADADKYTLGFPKVTGTIERATPTADMFACKLPEDLLYDGEPKEATVTTNCDGMGEPEVWYKDLATGAMSDQAPIGPGNYQVYVKAAAGSNYTATPEGGVTDDDAWKFTIERVLPDADKFSCALPEVQLYDGHRKAATVTSDCDGMGELKVSYKNLETATVSTLAPKDAGHYQVYVTTARGEKFQATSGDGVTSADWKFSIDRATPAENMFVCKLPEGRYYDGKQKAAAVTTNCDGMGTLKVWYKNLDTNEILTKAPKAPGRYQVYVTTASGDNYKATTGDGVTNDAWRFSIEHLAKPRKTYEIEGFSYKNGNSYWFKDNAVARIKPALDRYMISTKLDGEYFRTLTISKDSEVPEKIYLRKDENITEEIPIAETLNWDSDLPKVKISLDERNSWGDLLNRPSFGLFFKQAKTVSIDVESEDPSEIKKVEYFVSDKDLTRSQSRKQDKIKVLEAQSWRNYKNPILLEKDGKYIVYARVEDNVGHVTYASSQGIVIYSDAEALTTEFNYAKGSKASQHVRVRTNGNTINQIECNRRNFQEGYSRHYILSKDILDPNVSILTFMGSYLETLNKGEYVMTLFYNPQGEVYVDAAGNESPVSTQVKINV